MSALTELVDDDRTMKVFKYEIKLECSDSVCACGPRFTVTD